VPDRPPEIIGFQDATARVGEIELHYWLGGDPAGEPVLLWHGFLATGYVWRKVMPILAEAGLAVLVPDMRGFGDSDKPGGALGYDNRALSEEFRALVAQIGFGDGRPLTLVAHDMGAPPALIWAADHPEEIARLFYMEVPVMLQEVIGQIITFTPEAMQRGPMWWWITPFVPGFAERMIVGNERAFISWFFDRATVTAGAIEPDTVDEYLRTFSGEEGVLGALGVYRAIFTSMDQTAPLRSAPVSVPVVALGGERSQGARIGQMVGMVASEVETGVIPSAGHFLPEESPEEIAARVVAAVSGNQMGGS
jgi:pimeloyl-ACP methyl ester carboxylesterase